MINVVKFSMVEQPFDLMELANEPSFLATRAFSYARRPDRTSCWTHKVMDGLYGLDKGYPGNEDSGAMASWYVFSSLGFFPNAGQPVWEVPYLPIDPTDVGRTYEAVIRINSQSGKGGIAYVVEKDYGMNLPRRLQIEFSQVVQAIADDTGKELAPAAIWTAFQREYLGAGEPYSFVEHRDGPAGRAAASHRLTATIRYHGRERIIAGAGNGPIDAFVDAMRRHCGVDIKLVDYHEHAIGAGANATAVSYVEIRTSSGNTVFGVGMHGNIVTASLQAVLSAVNRALRQAEPTVEEGVVRQVGKVSV